MKYILLVILIFTHKYTYSAEWISEATAKITILKKIELPGGSTYSSFEINGAGKDNTGKLSTAVCVGHRIDKNNKLEEQKIYCKVYVSDSNEYSFMQIRKETDTDVGVGKSTTLNEIKNLISLSKNNEWVYNNERKGDVKVSVANIEPLKNIGWLAKKDVKQCIKQIFGV